MKRYILISFIMLVPFLQSNGQEKTDRLADFISNVLPQYSRWFTAAGLTPGGELQLTANDTYSLMPERDKQELMNRVTPLWKETLIVVRIGTGSELWGWDSDLSRAVRTDEWDRETVNIRGATVGASADERPAHPWFFYAGSVMQMDSEKNITGALNLRTGIFLLLNKWDAAVTFAESLSGNIESEDMSMQTSFGLMSRYYFPLEKHNISPNVGGELAVTIPSGGSASLTPSALLGFTWLAGPGSLDIGFRIGSSTSLLLGYTFIPRYKFLK